MKTTVQPLSGAKPGEGLAPISHPLCLSVSDFLTVAGDGRLEEEGYCPCLGSEGKDEDVLSPLERGFCTRESLWEKQGWSKARKEGVGVGGVRKGEQGQKRS